MKKRLFLPIAAVALTGLMASFATSAYAFPTKTIACTGCHGGAAIGISTTLVSTVGTTATYTYSAPGADAVVVFDGATKIFTFYTASGQFAVTTGKTYTLYAVTGPSTSDGVGSTTVSPVAPVVDTAAPSTVSDAKSTYVSSAAIKLTATDAGSGVASTYYKLDGGAQVTGTSVTVNTIGSHTLEFWSTDQAGNTEVHKTASFTITAPVVVDTTAPVTVSNALTSYVSSAMIKLTATDAGSGVASTYYVLDGGLPVSGTSITVTTVGAHTLQFWSVDVAGNTELRKTAAFTVTAPVVLDTTAPVTVSNALATYVTSAAIKLTATDTGSGVSGTYYVLDGGAQVAGTAISVTTTGTHTLEFWSVDVAGNAETRQSASFSVTDAVVAPLPGKGHTVKVKIPKEHARGHVATLISKSTGLKFTAVISKKGVAVFTHVPSGSYKLKARGKHGVKTLRTVIVRDTTRTQDAGHVRD